MMNNPATERINRWMESKPNPNLFSKLSANSKFEGFYQSCEDALKALMMLEEMKSPCKFDSDSVLAIRRMLGLYSDLEEFEKCKFIISIFKKCKIQETSPIFDYRQIYG